MNNEYMLIKKNLIGIFGGIFWPRNPYIELNLLDLLQKKTNYEIKIILWENDFRINKTKSELTKIKFNKSLYENKKNEIIIIKTIDELKNLSYFFDIILGNNMINDRTFMDHDEFFKYLKCPILIFDMMGYDILKQYFKNVNYICTKGKIFKEWLIKQKFDANNICTTGSILMDYYNESNNLLYKVDYNFDKFKKKYELNENKKILLFTTSNLRSNRKDMNAQNIEELNKLYSKYQDKYNFILMSYPSDYLFYELKKSQRRSENPNDYPDYTFIKNKFPKFKIIEAQDGYLATKYADKIFNISAGGLSIETVLFCDKKCYTMHFKDKEYYLHKKGYKSHVRFPDDISNIHLDDIEDMLKDKNDIINEKNIEDLKGFYSKKNAHSIFNAFLEEILIRDKLNLKKINRIKKLEKDVLIKNLKIIYNNKISERLEEISNFL